ncbi:hypothetical protein AGOR_G00193420 [Albula goreensis]|uniref:Uncharacterized protein n=1 Tax=Albula goreensis TaxID=1534307 RepID=A0A8T3CYN2_9TELE|nr:hypothetical protein AGOR_G00193420 [Albula goreensis]
MTYRPKKLYVQSSGRKRLLKIQRACEGTGDHTSSVLHKGTLKIWKKNRPVRIRRTHWKVLHHCVKNTVFLQVPVHFIHSPLHLPTQI